MVSSSEKLHMWQRAAIPMCKVAELAIPPRIPLTTWIENVPGQDQCLKQKSRVKTVKCGWKREASTNAQLLKLRSSYGKFL